MTVDRTTKTLLALILFALCALILRQQGTTVAAQSVLPPVPQTPAINVSADGTIYVVSGGCLSEWTTTSELDDGTPDGKGGRTYRMHDVLKLVDSKPLPSAAK